MSTKQDTDEIVAQFVKATAAAATPEALEGVRVGALGKKGKITRLFSEMKDLSAGERRVFG